MPHIFITGSADGLGRATAEALLGDGHRVIVHTRSAERLAAVEPLINEAHQQSSEIWPISTRRGRSLTRSTVSARSMR